MSEKILFQNGQSIWIRTPKKPKEQRRKQQMKLIKCKVCEAEFEPTSAIRYTARKPSIGMFDASNEVDCFDCIRCGCQIVAGPRYPKATYDFFKFEIPNPSKELLRGGTDE